MAKNIFKKFETEKEVPEETKKELIANIKAIKNGKDGSRLFHTKFYGALVNFFKLKNSG